MLARVQEDLSGQKAKEISSLKERLLSEKKAAVARMEQKMNEQVAKLQQQLHKARQQSREETVALEKDMSKQLAEEREKTEQLRKSLHSTVKVRSPVYTYMQSAELFRGYVTHKFMSYLITVSFIIAPCVTKMCCVCFPCEELV